MEAGHGYQRSMVLFVALRLDIFSALAPGPSGARELAGRVGADPGNLSILLNALVAMGLLRKTGERYRNGEAARRFLIDAAGSKRSILLHHLDCWADWTALEAKIRGGLRPAADPSGFQENFIRGMEENARERAAAVAGRIPLRRGERLLDLGGGPGTYAVEWARRHPDADITILDTRETLKVTRKILKEKGFDRLVRLREGDFLADPIGGPYDFIWVSQILHAYSVRDCGTLLRKARRALSPGGRIAVQEFLLEENKVAPPGPVFFAVHMVAVTEGGRSYTGREVAAMLSAAGFGEASIGRPDPRGVGIVIART